MFREKPLPEPELPDSLSADEWREALRACKGMMLRQEIYELDVDGLAAVAPKHTPVRIFSVATHNCHIKLLQARGANQHAVFLVTESEALNYQYDLALPTDGGSVEPDPRVSHTLNLRIDDFGNILESVAIVYPRRKLNEDESLSAEQRAVVHRVQSEAHLRLNCTDYTKDIFGPDTHRLPVPCQTRSWELSGISQAGDYFTLAQLRGLDPAGAGAAEISYHEVADGIDGPEAFARMCAHVILC